MSEADRYLLIQRVKRGELPTLTVQKIPEIETAQNNNSLEEKEEKLIDTLIELLKSEFKI